MPSLAGYFARREGDVVVAEWPHLGSFRSDRTPPFRAESGLSPDRTRKLEEGPVRALRRYLNGLGSLHASAVVLQGTAVAFLGESGAGKSTAAAMLCMTRGAEILSDDVLPVLLTNPKGVEAEEGDSSLWLFPPGTSHSGQKVSSRPKAASGAFPLKLLVRLVPGSGEGFSVRRLRGAEALRAIAAAWIRFPLGYDDRDFAFMSEFYPRVPLVEVVRPHAAAVEALLPQLEMVFSEFPGVPHAG